MATTHYEFPTVNGTDPISFVDTFNGLANAVDSALYTVDGATTGADNKAQTAIDNAASAASAASGAASTASAANQAATAASNTAAAANQTANTTATALNAFEQKFNLTPVSVTTGLGMTGFTYNFTLAQDTTGSIFKFYGHAVNAAGTAGSLTRVAIPGGSGNYTYGVDTGLVLNDTPETAYMVSPAGVRIQHSSSGSMNGFAGTDFAVGTNGHIFVFPQSSSSGSVSSSDRNAHYFMPCIYFNASFGDPGE